MSVGGSVEPGGAEAGSARFGGERGSLRARARRPSHRRAEPLGFALDRALDAGRGIGLTFALAIGLATAVLLPALVGDRGTAHAQITESEEEASGRSALCAGCHGADGNSTTPGVPSLAGQPVQFLEVQLRRFRDGERSSEAMQPIARELSESESHALAEHYASLPAVEAADDGDAALLAKGRAIATYRVCGSCHRSDFHGGGLVPRLAGQREDYLSASLVAYREHRRASPEQVMIAAADQLPDEHIRALAHYLAHCR